MRLIPDGEKVRLADLEPGTLFLFGDDCLALKTEYMTESGRIEAYIVGSGEIFHGGANTAAEQRTLIVQPLKVEDHCEDDLISRDYVMNEILSLHGVGGIYLYDPEEVHNIIANAPSAYGERNDNG